MEQFWKERRKELRLPRFENFAPLLSHLLSLHLENAHFPGTEMTPAERVGVLAVARGISTFEEHQASATEQQTRTMTDRMRRDHEAARRKAFGKR